VLAFRRASSPRRIASRQRPASCGQALWRIKAAYSRLIAEGASCARAGHLAGSRHDQPRVVTGSVPRSRPWPGAPSRPAVWLATWRSHRRRCSRRGRTAGPRRGRGEFEPHIYRDTTKRTRSSTSLSRLPRRCRGLKKRERGVIIGEARPGRASNRRNTSAEVTRREARAIASARLTSTSSSGPRREVGMGHVLASAPQ